MLGLGLGLRLCKVLGVGLGLVSGFMLGSGLGLELGFGKNYPTDQGLVFGLGWGEAWSLTFYFSVPEKIGSIYYDFSLDFQTW